MSKATLVVMLSLMTVTGSGCFLQPVERIEKQYNFIDMDAPALRLAKPVRAELLEKDASGVWVPIGAGEIPAGAYIKGRSPKGGPDGRE